ncbi:hypothetical protein [Rheinheimera maricola]|uniref:Uncharacterized protein n=1 Tax=Rheinheimera maricola TaxID=2793282 RepID=A0ABS7X8W5_9GAMM|nr:hypothetical protein [Rheinheimera maricola]MBZ9611979.1 hypothetical protein [Rheinheimera maricola]
MEELVFWSWFFWVVFALLLPEILVPLSIWALTGGGASDWIIILLLGAAGGFLRYGWMIPKLSEKA